MTKERVTGGEEQVEMPENRNRRFENESREDLIRRIEELEEMATKDYLTKAYNRHGFMEEMSHLFIEARKENEHRSPEYDLERNPRALLMLDIDGFKDINTTYGHPGGDAILRQVGDFLRDITRESDIICRWGGEEFIVIFQNTTSEEVFERFKNKTSGNAEIGFEATIGEIKVPITFSGGVIKITHREDIEKTIEKADKELYNAKLSGKNRIFPWKEAEKK